MLASSLSSLSFWYKVCSDRDLCKQVVLLVFQMKIAILILAGYFRKAYLYLQEFSYICFLKLRQSFPFEFCLAYIEIPLSDDCLACTKVKGKTNHLPA